jgi:hypothetical protein
MLVRSVNLLRIDIPQRKQHTGARTVSAKFTSTGTKDRFYWHCNAVQTAAELPEAEAMLRSMNPPAGIVTEPVAVQLKFVATEHDNDVVPIELGVPERNVTVIVADCCEYTLRLVAVHPCGTHAITDVASASDEFVVFTA